MGIKLSIFKPQDLEEMPTPENVHALTWKPCRKVQNTK